MMRLKFLAMMPPMKADRSDQKSNLGLARMACARAYEVYQHVSADHVGYSEGNLKNVDERLNQ